MGDLTSVLEKVVTFCETLGAEAEVFGLKRSEIITAIERGTIKLCIKQYSAGVGIRTLVKNSPGFSSCNSLEEDTVKETAEKAVAMARKTPALPFSKFAPPRTLPQISGLYDPAIETFDEETAISKAQDMAETARKDPRVLVDAGEFDVVIREKAISTSTGVSASEKQSRFSWYLVGMAREGKDVGSYEYYYGCCTQKKDLYLEETATTLAEKVVANLRPRKVSSFTGDLILSPDAVSGLISDPVTFSINGNNAYRGQSVLAEKRGQPVASDIVTIRDNATIPKDYNSSSFDREGSPHQNLAIVEKGIFKRFLYDSFAANRESSESTGSATGTFREIPKIGTTNFMVEKGSHSLDTLIAETEKGLLISRFSGTSQQVSGDFSGAVRGAQVIKSGEIQYPVKEATIAGNVFDILPRISGISKETLRYSQTVLPYIKISDMEFTA